MVMTMMRERRAKARSLHMYGPRPSEAELAALRTTLPSTNCVRCGDRGYCRHRPAPYGVSHGAEGAR